MLMSMEHKTFSSRESGSGPVWAVLLPDTKPEAPPPSDRSLSFHQVVLILAYSTIIVLGVLGNSLVIYVIYRFKTLRTVTNFFIANLAVGEWERTSVCVCVCNRVVTM